MRFCLTDNMPVTEVTICVKVKVSGDSSKPMASLRMLSRKRK